MRLAYAIDYGCSKTRVAAGAIAEYDQAVMIGRFALLCNMTERSIGKCIGHIINTAMDLPEIRAYMQPLTVDEVLHKLYEYCKK